MNHTRIKQSQSELKHILKRMQTGRTKDSDSQRKQELEQYLTSVRASLRKRQKSNYPQAA